MLLPNQYIQKQILNKLLIYNSNFFDFKNNLFTEEINFIHRSIKNISAEDIFLHEHISVYTFCPQVLPSGDINYGRFAFGKKTENETFNQITLELFSFFNLKLKPKKNFFFYGVGWDYRNNLIKLYKLSFDYENILCLEYFVDRSDFNNNKLLRKKMYNIGKKTTVMHKDDLNIEQINLTKSKKIFNHKPVDKFCEVMEKLNFNLDTYSLYNNITTLYFD